jgi:type VI secretion system protein ImpF
MVARSTINYGLPDITGRTASSVEPGELEKMIRRAIKDFEPRLLADSIKVKVQVDPAKKAHNTKTFLIEGELWAEPAPVRLFLKTDLDLETGGVTVGMAS